MLVDQTAVQTFIRRAAAVVSTPPGPSPAMKPWPVVTGGVCLVQNTPVSECRVETLPVGRRSPASLERDNPCERPTFVTG